MVRKKNAELIAHETSLHRIQNNQSSALDKLSEEKNFPGKVRDLLEELTRLKIYSKNIGD